MLMAAGTTLICELTSYIIQIIVFKLSLEILALIKILAVEILYNSMLIIIIYPLIGKAGEILERIFTEKSILTKYY